LENGRSQFQIVKVHVEAPVLGAWSIGLFRREVHGRASQRQMKYKVGSQKGAFFVPSSMLTLQATGSCNRAYCRMRG